MNFFKLKRKNNYSLVICILFIVIVGIGYAVLTSNLRINGLFTFTNNKWNIYLDNVVLDPNSATGDIPVISEDKTSVSFNAKLKKPFDTYCFYVDAVNDSSLDAMVNSVEIANIPEEYKKYVDVSITYFDGSPLNTNDKLLVGAISVIKVELTYKDITLEEIPSETINLDTTFSINYRQDDGTAVLAEGSNSWNFDFTGVEKEFPVPLNGSYKLETWGAQGKTNTYDLTNHPNLTGGYGGYSEGIISSLKNDIYYISVGQFGGHGISPFGGGGKNENGSLGGGGATHIASLSGTLASLENKRDKILIVSGGGGGNDMCEGAILSAGGFKAPNVKFRNNNIITGATQTSGGISMEPYNGSFGQGGNAKTIEQDGGGSGGGGFYGGAGSPSTSECGTGGSSYIGNTILTDKVMFCYECEESNEESTKTISTTNFSLKPISQYAKRGNGYARITYMG